MTAADLIILGVILLSGVLAMTRGLTREVFSILSWAFAALATLFLYEPLEPLGVSTFSFLPTTLAQGLTGVLIFVIVLLQASFVTMKLTEKLRGKEPGSFDGTAGFLFGLIRGYIIVCLGFLFYSWLAETDREPDWLADSALRPVIDKTNEAFEGLVGQSQEHVPEALKPSEPADGDDDLGRLIEQSDQ